MGQFKRGGLMISVDTGIPIVPVAFKGTFEMLEKGSWSMKNYPVEMLVGKPISPDSYSYETRRELANDVKTKVQELLSKA
jgi:1-acyl-sn-glycerol-3-phosphate acyltransferase